MSGGRKQAPVREAVLGFGIHQGEPEASGWEIPRDLPDEFYEKKNRDWGGGRG